MLKVVTHNGTFHADDVFAFATLDLLFPGELQLVRTRDRAEIESGEIIFDVGGVYDPETKRFDHHQEGGAGKRENGIPYAAFGLVWKEYGAALAGSEELAQKIDEKLAQIIDADDNGFTIFSSQIEDVYPYTLKNLVSAFNPTWKEETLNRDEIFLNVVDIAKGILLREVNKAQAKAESFEFVEKAYSDAEDKRLIVLDRGYPSRELISKHLEPLYVVFPNNTDESWMAAAVHGDEGEFTNRKDFPASWAGKMGETLAEITGVSDALFAHNSRHLAAARSKEGAIKLAQMAILA